MLANTGVTWHPDFVYVKRKLGAHSPRYYPILSPLDLNKRLTTVFRLPNPKITCHDFMTFKRPRFQAADFCCGESCKLMSFGWGGGDSFLYIICVDRS